MQLCFMKWGGEPKVASRMFLKALIKKIMKNISCVHTVITNESASLKMYSHKMTCFKL